MNTKDRQSICASQRDANDEFDRLTPSTYGYGMVQNYRKTQGNRYTSKMNPTAANLVPNFDPSAHITELRSPVGNHGKPVRSQTASWGPWRHLQSSAHPACRVNICMGKLRQAQKKQVHAVQSVQIFVQLFFNKWKEPETLIEGSGNHSCPMFL